MDYPLAIAIALPASTFIVTCGSLVGRVIHKDKSEDSSPGVSRKILDGILNKKFENVRYTGECEAISSGIKSEMKLTREVLHDGFEAVREEIRLNRGKM